MGSLKTVRDWRGPVIGALAVLAGCRAEKVWSVQAVDPATKRNTPLGELVGGQGRHGSHAWLGVPLAAPPVGERRWRAPQPPAAWPGTLEALTSPPACPQFANPLGDETGKAGEPVGSEDCLYVNVWTPPFAPEAVPTGNDRLPVMFWIHGGGNSIGRSAFYDGGHLAARERVVVVSTQFRLGPFGWFRHQALAAQSTDALESSGNFGTLDLVRGLEWVRDNVAAFGGDPGNVTIFGESAGGLNVYSLLLASPAKGLFHRAIVQSGVFSRTTISDAEGFSDDDRPGHKQSSNEVLARLLVRDGRANDRSAAKERIAAMSAAEIATFLRSRSMEALLRGYDHDPARWMLDMPLVFRDGALLPTGDWTERFAIAEGWNRVPVIIGTNRDEAKLFLFMNPRMVWKLFGLFPRYVDEPKYHAIAQALSRVWKVTGADEPAVAMRRSGAKDVYVYRFDWDEEPVVWGTDLPRMIGAAHGLEVPFVFGHFDFGKLGNLLFDQKSAPARLQLSEAMMSYWAEMARTGAPGRGSRGDLAPWTRWDDSAPGKTKFIILDTPADGGQRMSSEVETRERILADVDADPRLAAQVDKCRVFHELVDWIHGLTKEQYLTAGKKGCAEYPFDEFPWEGRN